MEYSAQRSIGISHCSLLISVAMSGAAIAQSGSAGGSIGNDEKSLSGSREKPRAVESSKPARRAKPESDEPRRASRRSGGGGGGGVGIFDGAWVVVAMGTPCGSSTERVVISGGRVTGEWSSGQVSPNGSSTGHGSAGGSELDQFGPHVGPQRLRFIRAIRWLHRTLDPLQTVGKTPVFRGFSPPQIEAAHQPQLYPICSEIAAHCHPSL